MVTDDVFKRIDRYLKKDYVQPLVIDVQNTDDLTAIRQHYNVGTNQFLSASEYCSKDSDPQLDKLYADLSQRDGVVFVTGLSAFLKLRGEQYMRDCFKTLLSLNTKGHIIVVTYQCKRHLSYPDPRLFNWILVVEGQEATYPTLVFVSEELAANSETAPLRGIDALSAIEKYAVGKIYVITRKSKAAYPLSLIYISDLNKAYDVIKCIDASTAQIPATLGTEEQWKYALEQFGSRTSWNEVVGDLFGNPEALEHVIQNYPYYSDEQRWLYFIALKRFGCPNHWCIQKAAETASGETEFIKAIYRSILSLDQSNEKFAVYYQQRKQVLHQLGNPVEEAMDFCKLVVGKGENTIYYLTDLNEKERELIFITLDRYGRMYDIQTLTSILELVYPALAEYLKPYRFKQNLLDYYFEQYKYQKVINKLLPEFEAIVAEQAEKREYNLILPPRSSVVERIDKTGAQLYFMDAMGVEFLSYILSQCKKMSLLAKVTVCRCELPSITSKNGDFLEYFRNGTHEIVSIKAIDEIKHHGKENFDYRRTKLPLHLSRELEILTEALQKIKGDLASGTIQKAVMIADHGATRLAVIHETENIWEMSEQSKHSGRCCPKSDVDVQPTFATDAGDFWALANYDRFRGGRRANVEVHGGATLEEITIPIIELTIHPGQIEVHILPADSSLADLTQVPVIEVSFRKKASIKIYISANVSDVLVSVDGKTYDAEPIGENYFYAEMPDIKKPKTYVANVYAGDNMIAERLSFKVKSEGMGSNHRGIL